MIDESTWVELEETPSQAAGVRSQRVAPDTAHDLFIVYDTRTGRRGLWHRFKSDAVTALPELPELRAISIEFFTPPPGGDPDTYLTVYLEESDLQRVFAALVNDLVDAICSEGDAQSALDAISIRLARWERLLRPAPTEGLSSDEIRGLVGELLMMEILLDRSAPAATVTRGWTGPYRRNQDFQFARGAIEVKATTAKQPQALVITNERELDDIGIQVLILAHLSLDERRGGVGRSLADVAHEVRTRVVGDPAALDAFDVGLIQCGLLPDQHDRYFEPRFTVREANYYRVAAGFPRITESDLLEGVGDVRYRVQIGALSPYLTDLDDLVAHVRGDR